MDQEILRKGSNSSNVIPVEPRESLANYKPNNSKNNVARASVLPELNPKSIRKMRSNKVH